jgi:hypothetical protein
MVFFIRFLLVITGRLKYKRDKFLFYYDDRIVYVKKLGRPDFYHPKTLVDDESIDIALVLVELCFKKSVLKKSIFVFPKDGFIKKCLYYDNCFKEIDYDGSRIVKMKLRNESVLTNQVFSVIIKKRLLASS